MQKTKIEWCDYSWNPVKGLCPTGCWYCYARAMYKRFKWNPELRLDQKELSQLILFKTTYPAPKRIFVGSTIDLFHPQIPKDWIETIVNLTGLCPEHTFIFLTKFPARYAEFDFPKNCWLGVTVTRVDDLWRLCELNNTGCKNLRFCSIEPFLCGLGDIGGAYYWEKHQIKWLIIGALTGPKAQKHPVNRTWVETLLEDAKYANIPVFLKPNLKSVWGLNLIQEFPEERG